MTLDLYKRHLFGPFSPSPTGTVVAYTPDRLHRVSCYGEFVQNIQGAGIVTKTKFDVNFLKSPPNTIVSAGK
jgi:hypothetical protein